MSADLEQTNTYDIDGGTGPVYLTATQYPLTQASSQTITLPPAAGPNLGWTYDAARRHKTMTDAPAIFFGDRSAVMYALNAESGEMLWKTRPVEHLLASATATPQFYKGVIYQGFSSLEESLAVDPNMACCSFRGCVAALDAATGGTIWQSFTITEPARPTGALLWVRRGV